MNFKKKLTEYKQYVKERSAVFDTLGQDFKNTESAILLMENAYPNWKSFQHGALWDYIIARRTGSKAPHIADCRKMGLYQMAENRRYFKSLGVFPVRHYCKTCRAVSTAPFLIGALVVKPFCKDDCCPSQWWNRPDLGMDYFKQAGAK